MVAVVSVGYIFVAPQNSEQYIELPILTESPNTELTFDNYIDELSPGEVTEPNHLSATLDDSDDVIIEPVTTQPPALPNEGASVDCKSVATGRNGLITKGETTVLTDTVSVTPEARLTPTMMYPTDTAAKFELALSTKGGVRGGR